MPTEEIKIAVLEEQMKTLTKGVDTLSSKIDSLSEKIDDSYLKKEEFAKFKNDEFSPVQAGYNKLLWWIITTLLTALGGLILAIINYATTRHT